MAPIALIAALGTSAWSGTLDDDVLIESSGDGIVYIDTTEGVVPPGMKAVTFTSTWIDDPDNPGERLYVDPFENIVTDFTTIGSRGGTTNCIMASNDNFCDSAPGSGKRIKNYLYGPGPFDTLLRTTPSADHPQVDYFTFGKISNFAPARITGFSIELLDADGNPMSDRDAAEAVLFNLDPDLHRSTAPSIHLVHGLFGNGGQEADTGFFSGDDADFVLTESSDVLDLGAILMAEDSDGDGTIDTFYADNFGDAMLFDAIVPDGIFWDETPDIADDEGALLTWYHSGDETWYYGTLGTAGSTELDDKLAAIAADLGVTVAELGYTAGGDSVPDAIVAAMQGEELFEVDKIEDLRNANLNYTITVGNVEEGQFTVRIAPRFAPIVELAAGNEGLFALAGSLDAANIPYLGADQAYVDTVAEIMALPTTAEQLAALESLGFTSGAGYLGTAFATANDQVFALGMPVSGSDGGVVSSNGNATNWSVGDNTNAFVSLIGRKSTTDRTASSAGFETDSRSVWAGLEREMLQGWSFGAMVGGGNADTTMDGNLGSIDSDTFGVGLYARTTFGSSGRLLAMVGYQDLSMSSERNVTAAGATALGNTDGSIMLASLKADWMKNMGNFNIGPMAALEYYDVSVDGYTETGAGAWNMTVGDMETEYVLASVGLRGETAKTLGGSPVRAFGHAAYTMQSGGDATISSTIGGLPTFNTPVDGMSGDGWFDVGFGLSAVIGQTASSETRIGGEYRGALFGDGYESHGLRLFIESSF
ncbi:choice-of-anchor F family protein [Salinihabitans flavidus]|uniref:choice-of-anchor F family protein n=1 Tax=Salinihabitans flavidus TaxID=569882 RepID=UPI001C31D8E0|nr:choice-of-anchor F family protein [Salinihabitans flavidus]